LSTATPKLLVAASGTGGHVYPALATAQVLQRDGCTIEWLGVPNRLETSLLPADLPLHTVTMTGLPGRPSLKTLKTLAQFGRALRQVRRLLRHQQFDGVFTTGGYIAAPAILAAHSLGLPTVLHESNALPGKVTRWLSPWCTRVALGFEAAMPYLPKAHCTVVGTPVRSAFLDDAPLTVADWPLPADAPLIVVVGGSQGAVAVNQLVRAAAPAWLEAGAWIFHQTGRNDPEADSFQHPHYRSVPFCDAMAPWLQRATLAVGRAGAGTLTELAMTHTPAVLIPYPYAAEDHQRFNAAVFTQVNAAVMAPQADLSALRLQQMVLDLLADPARLATMAAAAGDLATPHSAQQLAAVVSKVLTA